MNFYFDEPFWLFLFLFFLPLHWLSKKRKRALVVPYLPKWKKPLSVRTRFLSRLDPFLGYLCLSLLIFALARPQSGRSHSDKKTKGIDVMLAIDTSGSMRALDFKIDNRRVDRLSVVKNVLKDFIRARSTDRLGLVVFGSHAFAQVPLTLDHDVLLRYVEEAAIGMAGGDTAVGDAVGVAVNRLKDVDAPTKIVILLTDGANTGGKLDPIQAANIAKTFGIKVYTIGIGSHGPVPIQTELGIQSVVLDIDEKTLQQIAQITSARYFSASDTAALEDIYKTIDKLEKKEAKLSVFYSRDEQFGWFVGGALICLCFQLFLALTRFKRIP